MQCKCMIPVPVPRAGIRQIAREKGIDGETADSRRRRSREEEDQE